MAQSGGRIVCGRCGANNFESEAVCWQCRVPLRAEAEAPRPTVPLPALSASPPPPVAPARPESLRVTSADSEVARYTPHTKLLPQATEIRVPAAPPAPQEEGDPKVAKRAAIALALTFPYFGLPIGWAFMMMPDRRRQSIGRYCAYWSAGALLFHILLLSLSVSLMGSLISRLTPSFNAERDLENRIHGVTGGPSVP